MILSDALNRILFKIGSIDDIQNRALNQIVSTSNIIYELNEQMKYYAMYTKGIQDFFSRPITSNDQFISAPTNALRSQAYNYAYLITRGWVQPLDIRGQKDTVPIFRGLPIKSVGGWIVVMSDVNAGINSQKIYFYPMSGTTYNTTTLTSSITSSDTTIPVANAGSFITTNGRITIGSEIIQYKYRDLLNFYECSRGLEGTTAASANNGATVKENNLIIHYCRLPTTFTVTNSPSAPALATNLEIVEEHVNGVVDIVSYNLLAKISPERATAYKVDAEKLYEQYKMDIAKGYGHTRNGAFVRDAWDNETGQPNFANRY